MGKAKSKTGEGEAGEQPTVHQGQCTKKRKKEKKKKKATSPQPPATSHQQKPMLQQCTATPPAMVARGKRAPKARGDMSLRRARLHRKRRWRGEGTQRVGVAAEMNLWEMLVSADSPTLHRPQGTYT